MDKGMLAKLLTTLNDGDLLHVKLLLMNSHMSIPILKISAQS
jgi:hypothetical protein